MRLSHAFRLRFSSPNVASTTLLRRHMDQLLTFNPRSFLQPRNLDHAAQWMQKQLQSNHPSWKPKLVGFSLPKDFSVDHPTLALPPPETRFYNVELDIPSRFPKPVKNPFIIGAHYDAVFETPGADDNASGIAGILELARLFAMSPPPFPLKLLAWVNEENPTWGTMAQGAEVHAQSLIAQKIKPRAVISLEMIGRYYSSTGTQQYPVPFLDHLEGKTGNFAAFVSPWGGLRLIRQAKHIFRSHSDFPIKTLSLPGWFFGNRLRDSDHWAYLRRGIPAFMVTDTSNFRHQVGEASILHTPEDTVDHINFPELARLITGIHRMITHWPV